MKNRDLGLYELSYRNYYGKLPSLTTVNFFINSSSEKKAELIYELESLHIKRNSRK
jgi:hypothetical protein